MSKQLIRYVDSVFGACLRVGSVEQIRNSIGRENVHSVRNATDEDVAWVRCMGGKIPDGRIAKQGETA